MGNLGVTEIFFIVLFAFVFGIVVTVWPYWRIFRKAGFSAALSILMMVPIANIVMLFYLAYAEWPAMKNDPQ
jgi:uncharacterized membrane protein YagU involved in acid resistance